MALLKNFRSFSTQAAESTQRPNHGYAAINCAQQPELCQAQEACSLPMFKIYSRGNILSTMREVFTFTADVIKGYVESVPVLREANANK